MNLSATAIRKASRTLFTALTLLLSSNGLSQAISLEQAMADPDWIGRAPQQPYWADDSNAIYYHQKREGSEQTDLFRVELNGDDLEKIEASEFDSIDVAGDALSSNNRLKTYSREGDIYVKNLRNGDITQLTRTATVEDNPQFTADNQKVIFRRNNTVFVRDLDSGLEYQAAEIRLEDAPSKEEEEKEDEEEYLQAQQSRLFEIIRLQEQREKLEEQYSLESQQQDPSRIDPPYYLGKDMEIVASELSPNENWMIVSTRNSTEQELGRAGNMPNYVTASGYVENNEVRNRVGSTDFANQQLFLFDLRNHQYAELDLSTLPNRDEDPLAEQLPIETTEAEEAEETEEDEEAIREVQLAGITWSDDGNRVLFQAISRDNKDRWLLSLDTVGLKFSAAEQLPADDDLREAIDLQSENLQLIHHNHDPAWINRGFINASWLPDSESILFMSEQDGYGHLYLFRDGTYKQLTMGNFEVREADVTADGSKVYFRANIVHPTIYEIYALDLASQELQQISELGGMNEFRLSPDESKLLVLHSDALHPTELYLQNARANARVTRLSNTISEKFQAIEWAQPEFVEVPSSYVDDPIHSRVYTPEENANNSRAAVVFIHGAGYLQNAHQGWSGYFREFMFHSFLVKQGYVVLDMDYRASSGYGRDWRTDIYQQMGTPEVQDLTDGVDWLVQNRNVDRDRVCTYGGSYGGFLTLMAMFNRPDLFACGAALRPVTDWAHYNHGYTSNILNIPELDPSAYERSSPIEFAEGLEKPLLIAHGMQDNNVFFQDSVRLVQRLIELKKENWELAIYPIEAHGFREPSSWLDEYRRIFNLFEENLGN